nr:hypothetical protein [Tanacetum cinerariifolium]
MFYLSSLQASTPDLAKPILCVDATLILCSHRGSHYWRNIETVLMTRANLYDGANQAIQSFHEVMQIKTIMCAMQRSWLHTSDCRAAGGSQAQCDDVGIDGRDLAGGRRVGAAGRLVDLLGGCAPGAAGVRRIAPAGSARTKAVFQTGRAGSRRSRTGFGQCFDDQRRGRQSERRATVTSVALTPRERVRRSSRRRTGD